jgi:hypothetical protein
MQRRSNARSAKWIGASAIKRLTRALVVIGAAAAFAGATASPSHAAGLSPDQLTQAGWTCVRPLVDPTREICAPPGQGLPPLPGTPGFADRGPSYELRVFQVATGDFIGVQHLLRPDIYLLGTPPCPQQPNGAYVYVPRNDTWSCLHET